jgi:hypothetical protein
MHEDYITAVVWRLFELGKAPILHDDPLFKCSEESLLAPFRPIICPACSECANGIAIYKLCNFDR